MTESGTLLTVTSTSTAGSSAQATSKDKHNIEATDKKRLRWSARLYKMTGEGCGAYASCGCFKYADDSLYTAENGWYDSYRDYAAANQLNPGTTSPYGSQKTYEATVDGTNTHLYITGVEQGNSPQAAVAKMYFMWQAARGDIAYAAKVEVDWVFVSKFVATEPANSTWGPESPEFINVTDSAVATEAVSLTETLTVTDSLLGTELVYLLGEVLIDGLRLDHALTIRVSEPTTISSKPVSAGLPTRLYLGRQGRTLEIGGWVATVAELNVIAALADGAVHEVQLPTGSRVSVHIPSVNPGRPIEPGEYPYTIRAVERMD